MSNASYLTNTMACKIILKKLSVYVERAEHVREVDDYFLLAGGTNGWVRDVRLEACDVFDPADRFSFVLHAFDTAISHRPGKRRRVGRS